MPKNCLHTLPAIVLLSLPMTVSGGCGILENDRPQPSTAIAPPLQEIVQEEEVRALPGKLNTVPVFNSNSPEWLKTEGILLSTFPPNGKPGSTAHLNFPMEGRFDLFVQHFTHAPKDFQTFYLGVILHNPGKKSVTVEVLQAASYLLQDAPWIPLSPYVENPENTVYGGPGDRAVGDVLIGKRQADFPKQMVIPSGSSQMLLNLPMPVWNLKLPINGRSTFMRLRSNDKVYAASLVMFAKKNPDGSDRSPTLSEWQALLDKGDLAGPRTHPPTSPQQIGGQLIYGQVAGVSSGSQWQAQLVDRPGAENLTIPQPGQAVAYTLSTLRGGQLGTAQVQAAKMLVRYPDTAYEAHGNYAVEYNLDLPLHNANDKPHTVSLTIETPLKEDKLLLGGLRFQNPPVNSSYFSGTVRLSYQDEQGQRKTRYLHIWQRTGQIVEPLLQMVIPPATNRLVRVDFFYPPDSTPPQVLTLRTER